MSCRCHSDAVYRGLHDCPACGHRSLDCVGDYAACERRGCAAEFRWHEDGWHIIDTACES